MKHSLRLAGYVIIGGRKIFNPIIKSTNYNSAQKQNRQGIANHLGQIHFRSYNHPHTNKKTKSCH